MNYLNTKIPKLINDNILDLPEVQQYTPTTEEVKTSIDDDFSKFKDYQKLNSIAYSEADRYWKRFLKYKKKAEKLNTYKNHQYFENAVLAFQKSINHLQSIGINTTEKEYKDGFKEDDFKRKSEIIDISKKTRDLYMKGTIELNNLAEKVNDSWKKKPNPFSKPVYFDINLPEPFDITSSFNFDYYV